MTDFVSSGVFYISISTYSVSEIVDSSSIFTSLFEHVLACFETRLTKGEKRDNR